MQYILAFLYSISKKIVIVGWSQDPKSFKIDNLSLFSTRDYDRGFKTHIVGDEKEEGREGSSRYTII